MWFLILCLYPPESFSVFPSPFFSLLRSLSVVNPRVQSNFRNSRRSLVAALTDFPFASRSPTDVNASCPDVVAGETMTGSDVIPGRTAGGSCDEIKSKHRLKSAAVQNMKALLFHLRSRLQVRFTQFHFSSFTFVCDIMSLTAE